jgi:hypothetical protein
MGCEKGLRDILSAEARKMIDREVMPYCEKHVGPDANSNTVIAWLIEEVTTLRRRLEKLEVDVDIIEEGNI